MKKKSVFREYAEAILVAIILALLIRTFVVQAFKIPSGSMIPTLVVGDHILVNKFVYYFREPKRGDVIVFKYPWDESRDFIKRVIAIGGEEVRIKDRTVFVDGQPLEEPYAIYSDARPPGGSGNEYAVVVPQGSFFVMGDNRDNSQDSRFWGFLKREKIRGKSFLIYWSWDSDMGTLRWWRLGRLLL